MASEVYLNKQDFDRKIKLFYQYWDKVSILFLWMWKQIFGS